jgi:hypothetical protein
MVAIFARVASGSMLMFPLSVPPQHREAGRARPLSAVFSCLNMRQHVS